MRNRKPERHELDLAAWREWDAGGKRPEQVGPLLDRFSPMIHKKVNVFDRKVTLSRPVLTAEAERLALKAFQTYDPAKGKLGTHTMNHLTRLQRTVQTYQFGSRLTEPRANLAGKFKSTKASLIEDLNREPSAQEIATAMMIPLRQAEKLMAEVDSVISEKSLPGQVTFAQGREREMALMIRQELTGEEQAIFDYITGTGGKPEVTKSSSIARLSRIPLTRVYQKRASIMRKLKGRLERTSAGRKLKVNLGQS